jgi:hypothetical protein
MIDGLARPSITNVVRRSRSRKGDLPSAEPESIVACATVGAVPVRSAVAMVAKSPTFRAATREGNRPYAATRAQRHSGLHQKHSNGKNRYLFERKSSRSTFTADYDSRLLPF